jgi:hypothetical protein
MRFWSGAGEVVLDGVALVPGDEGSRSEVVSFLAWWWGFLAPGGEASWLGA